MRGQEAACAECGKLLVKKRFDQKFCSAKCCDKNWSRRQTKGKLGTRICRHCGDSFEPVGQADANRQYCSLECSREGAKKSRQEFYKRNPRYHKETWRRRAHKDVRKRPHLRILSRLKRKFPDLPEACESCRETRVLDVAHKPEFSRNGSWATMDLLKRHMFWILCPTCHALLDRGVCSPQQLNLRDTLL